MVSSLSLAPVDWTDYRSVAIYYETHAIPQRLNAGIVVASVAVSILGSYASLFVLGKRTSNSGIRNIVLLITSATTMAFVGIWSMHFIGMYMRLEATKEISWYIRYNPGFAAFSFIAPAIALIVSFLFLDQDIDGFRLWKVILAGTLTGCTVSLMHYSASFYCNFEVTFSPAPVVGSILLACLLCIVGLTAFFRFRYQWQDSWWKRLACAVSLGLGVSGMHYVGVSGTSYWIKPEEINMKDLYSGKKRNLTLVCVIAVICFIILSTIAIAGLIQFLVQRDTRKKARMIVVASATFDKSGRIMVNGDGTLPLITVEERALRCSQVISALDQRSTLFQWLYALSWDWEIIAPFVGAISKKAYQTEKSRGGGIKQKNSFKGVEKIYQIFSRQKEDFESEDPCRGQTNLFDFRDKVIDAAHRLAKDLDTPLSGIGIFYDHILPTGTRKEAEKAQQRESSRNRMSSFSISGVASTYDEEMNVVSRPSSVFGKGDDEQEGVTMFLVREVQQEGLNQLAKKGYRFTETRFLTNILAERHGVLKKEMESTLDALKLYAKRGTKPIVQAGGYYAGLFCVRTNACHQSGSLDVLVYNFARHQVPAFRLPGVTELTSDIASFLSSIDQAAVDRVLMTCQVGSSRLLEDKKRIQKLLGLHVSVEDELRLKEEQRALDALIQFQQGLFVALKTLHESIPFFPQFLTSARVSAKMVELPSNLVDPTSPPAHLILVQAILPTEKVSKRGQAIEPTAPFVFTPYTLFAKTQMMMLGGKPAEEFERAVTQELEMRYTFEDTTIEKGDESTSTNDDSLKSPSSRANTDEYSTLEKMTKSTSDSSLKSKRGKRSILESSAKAMSEQGARAETVFEQGRTPPPPPRPLLGRRRLTESSCEKSLYDVSPFPTPDLEYEMQIRHNRENTYTSSDGHHHTISLVPPPRPQTATQPSTPSLQQVVDTVPELLSSARRPSAVRTNTAASSNSSQQGFHQVRSHLEAHVRNTSDHWQTRHLEELERNQPNLLLGIMPDEY